MKNPIVLLFILSLLHTTAKGQITTSPTLPTETQSVTITFDSSEESRLGQYTGDLYAHTGVIIEGNNDWQHVIGSWNNNSTQPKLTHVGEGIYELEITPDIRSFYNVPEGEKVVRLAFVFRSADSQRQTNDLFVDVFEEGLVVQITAPAADAVYEINQDVTITAQASTEALLKLFVNENLLAETNGQSISASHTFAEAGSFWLIAEASSAGEAATDSASIFVRNTVQQESMPETYRKGINYLSDTSVALVLWAPYKEHVFVIGDFNDWKLHNDYLMKKDGDYFWLEINSLEPGREYAFQYLIDGEIKVADPYTEKILDPWNDQHISEETYPGLKPYPENHTEGIVSVLQTNQEEYQWQVTDFQVPEVEELVIYELLIRDFTEEHTFQAVREKLDYLRDLNINVLELMPVNEFEGNSSWGYNPSFYFAPDKYYGPKNELKKLIDECHQRGIAVVIDMVLNHSYGQSPFVQMYMDNWNITPESPWYNVESNFQNPSLRWGYDFNHNAEATRELVDSVNSFWINEYKIDGFRFDFTKGFSNTPYGTNSWGSEYDAERVANLKRMTDEIREQKEDALIIFEHLADNTEEKELADYGILMWGNMHGSYTEAARGNAGNSDLSWGIYTSRGWNEPNLITYAESHDEERVMVRLLDSGFIEGDYNIRQLPVALDRKELISVFHIPLPGPKMIWQFGERGYDVSIDAYGGRLSEKPPRWEYLENSDRTDLFDVVAQLNYLKQTYQEFTPEEFEFNLAGQVRWYTLTNSGEHVLALGNFGITEANTSVSFPESGKWYEFFPSDSITVDATSQDLFLAPGEYRLYSSRKLEQDQVVTETSDMQMNPAGIRIYPNPASGHITVTADRQINEIQIFSPTGRKVYQSKPVLNSVKIINLGNLNPGVYFVHILQEDNRHIQKIVVK
ncbi:MAG: alpha-amylase family glycosyl hydrolase [Mariniphaga sp.]